MDTAFRLDDITFPLLIKDTIESLFTGIIFASSDRWKKGLIFREGVLCAVQSNKHEELLGHILVDIGFITEEENEESLARARVERRKQGVILLEMQKISAEAIKDAVRQQFEKRFLDIFTWETGTIQKVAKDTIEKSPDISRNEFHRLVRRGIIEHTPFSVVISALSPHADAMPKKRGDDLPVDLGVTMDNFDQFKVSELLLLGQDPAKALLALYCTGLATFEESKHKALIDQLRKTLRTFKDQSPFQTLGVDEAISDGGFKRAYIKLVKQHHPDTYAYAEDPEVKRLANEVFTEIQKAYNTVSRIRDGKPPEESTGIDESLQAEILYGEGMDAMRRKDYGKALDCFRLCTGMRLDEKVFAEAYVRALFLRWQNTNRGTAVEVKSAIHEAVQKFPSSDTLYVILGWVLKGEGSRKAPEAFRKALQINPNNAEAQRELRLYTIRSSK
jgi:tetratricopeptide (TPR) repeat protein